jgi:hypothetical protein
LTTPLRTSKIAAVRIKAVMEKRTARRSKNNNLTTTHRKMTRKMGQ